MGKGMGEKGWGRGHTGSWAPCTVNGEPGRGEGLQCPLTRHPKEAVLTEESRLARGKPWRVQSQEACLPQGRAPGLQGCCARQSRGLGAGGAALQLLSWRRQSGILAHNMTSTAVSRDQLWEHSTYSNLQSVPLQLSLHQRGQELWRRVSESRCDASDQDSRAATLPLDAAASTIPCPVQTLGTHTETLDTQTHTDWEHTHSSQSRIFFSLVIEEVTLVSAPLSLCLG